MHWTNIPLHSRKPHKYLEIRHEIACKSANHKLETKSARHIHALNVQRLTDMLRSGPARVKTVLGNSSCITI